MTRILLPLALVASLSACAGTRYQPLGVTYLDVSSGGCTANVADGKERADLHVTGTICGGQVDLSASQSGGLEKVLAANAQTNAALAALVAQLAPLLKSLAAAPAAPSV